jgi:plasmid stabilization system protein ParE
VIRRIVIRPLADQHMDEQARYIAARETFDLIAKESEIGKRTNYQNSFLKDSRVLRMKTFDKHLVFYRFHPEIIEILDIVHSARDIENLY